MKSKNYSLIRQAFLGSLSLFFLLPLSCCKEPPPPIPMYFEMDPTMRKFLYFEEGSWWVYKSNDGLYDTITVKSTYIENRRNVDKEGNLISTQEYFLFTYHSSYWKYGFSISRTDVAPTVATIDVIMLPIPGTGITLFRTPNDIGVRYKGTSTNSDFFSVIEKKDTTVNGSPRKIWIVDYNSWSAYGYEPVKVTFVEGLGMTQKITEFENRTWDLVSHHLIPF